MSRHNCEQKNGKTVSFGYDNVMGYFVQQWDINNQDKPILDLDSKFDKLSRGTLVEFLHENLTESDLKKYSSHINNIALDLPC